MTSANSGIESTSGATRSGVSKHLTAPEVADILRVGPWQVIQLCRSGKLRATKPGKSWLIDPADLQVYLDAHTNQPSQESA